MINDRFDREELELLESLENDEWKSVKNLDEEIKNHKKIAKNTLKRDKRINIKISSKDLQIIKTTAMELGLPYQNLVSSILHQYATGKLVQKE